MRAPRYPLGSRDSNISAPVKGLATAKPFALHQTVQAPHASSPAEHITEATATRSPGNTVTSPSSLDASQDVVHSSPTPAPVFGVKEPGASRQDSDETNSFSTDGDQSDYESATSSLSFVTADDVFGSSAEVTRLPRSYRASSASSSTDERVGNSSTLCSPPSTRPSSPPSHHRPPSEPFAAAPKPTHQLATTPSPHSVTLARQAAHPTPPNHSAPSQLCSYASPTPTRVCVFTPPPPTPRGVSPFHDLMAGHAHKFVDQIDDAVEAALGDMKPREVEKLLCAPAGEQAKWLCQTFFEADIHWLGASPVDISGHVVKALEYRIPGSAAKVWIVASKPPRDSAHSPSTPGSGVTSFSRPWRRSSRATPFSPATTPMSEPSFKLETPTTPLSKALAELALLPKDQREKLNASPQDRTKWLCEREQAFMATDSKRKREPIPASPAVLAAIKIARLPTKANTAMNAVVSAVRELSEEERAVVNATKDSSEAWRREIMRLWNVKKGLAATESTIDLCPPPPTSCPDNQACEADDELDDDSDSESQSGAASSESRRSPPSPNPFAADGDHASPKLSGHNAFTARLLQGQRATFRPSPLRHSTNSDTSDADVADTPSKPGRGIRRTEAPEMPMAISGKVSRALQLAGSHVPAPSPLIFRTRPSTREKRPALRLTTQKPPSRELDLNMGAIMDAVQLRAFASQVKPTYREPTTPRAWEEYTTRVEVDKASFAARVQAETEAQFEAEKDKYRRQYCRHVAARGAHQWEYVAPLVDPASMCTKYRELMVGYPKWVSGEEVWVDAARGRPATTPCHVCTAVEHDRRLLRKLEIAIQRTPFEYDENEVTSHDIATLKNHIQATEDHLRLAGHACPSILLDSLPDDAITVLEYRIFYGLGSKTATVPCLFWSNPAAFDTAATKLARLRAGVDPVNGRVHERLLHSIKALTSSLRTELHTLGAFVGWLSLDYGIAKVPKESMFSPSKSLKPPSSLSTASSITPLPLSRQYMSNSPLTERAPTGPDRVSYRATYERLGPDASFWYDRLERSVVMFDVSYNPSQPWSISHPPIRNLTPARKEGRYVHLEKDLAHCGTAYSVVSLAGEDWRRFPDEGRPLGSWPVKFRGTTMPVVAICETNRLPLAPSLSNRLFDLAVRWQHL